MTPRREQPPRRTTETKVVSALEKEKTALSELNVKGEWQAAANRYSALEQQATPEVVGVLLEAALANRMLSGTHYNDAERMLNAARALATGKNSEAEVLTIVGLGDLYRSAAKKNKDFHPELGREGKLQAARSLEQQAQQALLNVADGSLARVKAHCEFGLLDVEEGQYDQALVDYTAATTAAERLFAEHPADVIAQSQLSRTHTLTGEAHDKLGSADEAYVSHEKAYSGYVQISDKRGMALGQQGMALALEKKGDMGDAVLHWQEVERIANSGQEVDNYMADKAKQALARLTVAS